MRTSTIIIVIIIAVAGVAVFSILNKPANLLIRKTFKELSGLAIIDGKAYDLMKEENKELSKRAKALGKERENIEKEYNELLKHKDTYKAEVAELQKELASTYAKLESDKETFEQIGIDEQLTIFDRETDGNIKSILIDFHGIDMAAIDPSRLASANWIIHQGKVYKKQVEVLEGITQQHSGQIQKLEALNINLVAQLHKADEIAETRTMQYYNCEAARREVISSAQRKAWIGWGAGITGVAIGVLVIMLSDKN